jgi:hypothetical protein
VCLGLTSLYVATGSTTGFGFGLNGEATEQATNSHIMNTISVTRMATNKLDGR